MALKTSTALDKEVKRKVKEYLLKDDTPVLSIQSDGVSCTDTSSPVLATPSSPSTNHSLAYQLEHHNASESKSQLSDITVGLPVSSDSNQHCHSYACFDPVQAMLDGVLTIRKQQTVSRDQPEQVSSKAPTADSVNSYETAEKQKFESSFEHNLKFSPSLHEGSPRVTEHEIEDDQLVKSVNINDQGTSKKEHSNASQGIDLIGLQQASELKNRKLILGSLI